MAKQEKLPERLNILCPFCNSFWSSRMEMEYLGSSSGCSTCGYGAYTEMSVEIYCDNCKRLVYKKEGHFDR